MWDERATNLGKIIYRERKKKGLTQEELFRGICTQGELTKIESGERVPEKMLADALMQRLGKCTDTLEVIMSVEEYILFDLRETLQRHFFENDYEHNQNLLEEYSRHRTIDQKLHQQFLAKYAAVNEYRRDGNALRCRKALGEALAITFPEWEGLELMRFRLCNQELHLLILLGYSMMQTDEARAVQILEEVAAYLEKRYYEEEKVKLFPQCMWLLALRCKRRGEWDKVEAYSCRGVECLTKNGALPLLVELLELRIESFKEIVKVAGEKGTEEKEAEDKVMEENETEDKMTVDASACKKVGMDEQDEDDLDDMKKYVPKAEPENDVTVLAMQLESLKALLRCYADWVLGMDELSKLHYFYHEEEISLDYEMLRDIRKNQGISQSDLESCTQGNLSRIENGKQIPSKKHVLEIAGELGVEKSYYISRVQSDNYDLYELCHWKNQASFDFEWDKATEIIDELAAVLDMDIPLNRQYIETCRIGDKKVRGEINPEDGLQQLERILRYTMTDYRDGKMRIPSREEFVILNLMAGFSRKAGRMKKGLELRERMLKAYQKSRVKEEYHTNSVILLYLCYGEMLESDGQLKLAKEMDNFGILLEMWSGKCKVAGKILANLAFVYNKSDSPEKYELQKSCLWHSYQICLLMQQKKLAKIIEDGYYSLFAEDINASLLHLHQTDQTILPVPDKSGLYLYQTDCPDSPEE